MTIINPNSISGISSITALNSTAAINLFKADGTSANIIVGVTTATTFSGNLTGTVNTAAQTNITSLGTLSGLDVAGDVSIIDTATDSAAGPELKLFRNSASPANADYLGQLKFAGESSTGVERNYAKITGKILDVTNGSEDGILEFAHIKGGSQTITGRWRSDSLQLLNSTNFSVAGNTTLTGDLDVDGHTNLDNISIAGVTTVANDTRLIFGANATANTNLRIKHNSSNSRNEYRATYQDFFTTDLRIHNISNNAHFAYFWSNQISLFASGSEKLQIVGGGVNILNGNLTIPDQIIHSGDTDTAIRFPADNTIRFEVGNEQAVHILPSSAGSGGARMGLGTNSPTGMLHIYGANPPVRIQNSNDSANLQFGMWDTANIMFQASNRTFKFATETSNDINFFTGGLGSSNERLRIASGGMITLGNPTNTVLKAEINNSVSGHYFVSQCSDNNNGFEIYQQHGSTTTRNTLAVYNNSTGSKHLNFYVRGDNQVWISTVKDNTALVLDGTSSGTYYGETGGRIEFLMNNEVNQFTGNFAARISPYLQRGNNGFGLKFDVRHNASTTYKALDLTADYSVLPGLDNTITLGSSSYRWSNIYTADLHCSNEGSKNDVDGTWGDYTIQEGESDLFLINNRSGKKYKFNLTEVS